MSAQQYWVRINPLDNGLLPDDLATANVRVIDTVCVALTTQALAPSIWTET